MRTHYDVLIIGAGMAGLRAAIAAAEEGAEVLILEKMNAPGGNTLISDGALAVPGTDIQQAQGVEDSPALLAADMLQAGVTNDEALVRIVSEGARTAFEWARSLGIEFQDRADYFGGHSRPRSHTPREGTTGRPYIRLMKQRAKQLGVKLLTKTRVAHLLLDGSRVEGVHTLITNAHGETAKEFRARAVVLASGGYGADAEYLGTAVDPRLAELDTTNSPSATSEVLQAAAAAGAKLIDIEHVQLGAWASPDEKGFGVGPSFGDYIAFPYGIIVDDSGKRFVNELGDRRVVADALIAHGRAAFTIADGVATARMGQNLQKALKKKVIQRFETIEALADAYGIDADILRETIQTYNAALVGDIQDPFSKPFPQDAKPLATPPFHAMRLSPKIHHTMGGVAIDTSTRVLRHEGTFENLFAAGEICGGVHGQSRLGSCALTECLVMGERAGRRAASGKR